MRPLRLTSIAVLATTLLAACGLVEGNISVALAQPVSGTGVPGEAATAKECGACHLAYQPTFMPARSWSALTAHLATHFGEDASLDAATTRAITAYLTGHAADSPFGRRFALVGLAANETPQRITDMPWWRRRHHRLVARGEASGPGIRQAAKCDSCHGRGGADDD